MKSKFENSVIFLFLLISISLISCGGGDVNFNLDGGNFKFPPFRNTDFKAEEAFAEEVEVDNRLKMIVKGANDKITITGVSGATSVIITAMKRVRSDSNHDAAMHLHELEIKVQSLANEILLETILPKDTGGRTYEVDYMIALPKDLKIQITNVNRNVILNAIDNDVTVNIWHGDVILNQIFGSALVKLTNGTIKSEIDLPLDGTIDLHTVNGNINLAIPENTSAELSASVTFGSISVSNLVLQNEASTSTSLIGTLGNGRGTISLKAEVTGDISVSDL